MSDKTNKIYGVPFGGKVLVFPNSVGSSVGAYVIYRLKKNRKAPKAIINQHADIITASGCAIAGIALYDLSQGDLSKVKDARQVSIDQKRLELVVKD